MIMKLMILSFVSVDREHKDPDGPNTTHDDGVGTEDGKWLWPNDETDYPYGEWKRTERVEERLGLLDYESSFNSFYFYQRPDSVIRWTSIPLMRSVLKPDSHH